MQEDEILEGGDESTIAIVGMACHLPGALNIDEYWTNLRDGVESVRFYTDEELLEAGESPAALADPNYVRAQPELKDYDQFDAKFWGFSPQDAAVTDPAHRLFLEVAYQSLEHAGHTGYDEEGRVGVYATSGASLYWMDNLKSNPQLIEEMGEFLVRHTGNDMNFLATRLSYELDLRGPSLNVQTACSSTLVAIHMAVQSLLSGECDMAIAGGSTVLLPQKRGYIYKDGEILSPDGHCRPFDKDSAGTIFGSGAGSVVLRRLDDALADGDTIYGTIIGSAINNDGAQKIGYLAPGVEGQAAAISEALAVSGVKAENISYVEAHGTGTQVGDPIEFEALNQIYRDATDKRQYCRLGSVKSNIGHLGEAAGAAAIIKVILSLQNKKIPASINYQAPNPQMEIDDSPFVINDHLANWDAVNGQRIAAVTALGAGGTNAHIIVGEPPEIEAAAPSMHNQQLLILSAKTSTALNAASRNFASALRDQDQLSLADAAYTLQIGRRAYSHRRVLAVKDREEAIVLLEGGDVKRVADNEVKDGAASLVFMFPGGGAQYVGMGAELYQSEAVYRDVFDQCMSCLDAELASDIRAQIFAAEGEREAAAVALAKPSRTLPALFATEYALAKQFMAWGSEPAAFIGHSMGEYTAACLSGVIQLKDAMRLVALRGQLFERVAGGGMLSISLSESDARQHMSADLDIAAVNAPDLCVASGPVKSIEDLQAVLEQKEIDCTRVRIDVAAHSSMLDEILPEFRAFCNTIKFSQPEIPFTSNLTGDWISDQQATDPEYWVEHLRNTVKFSANVTTVLAGEPRVLVEIGPGRTLANLAQAGNQQAVAALNSMRHASEKYSDVECALRAFGQIWANGVNQDWRTFWGSEKRSRIALPTYPFEQKAYWVDPGVAVAGSALPSADTLVKRPNIDDWFGRLSWVQRSVPIKNSVPIESSLQGTAEIGVEQAQLSVNEPTLWLIFEDDIGLANSLIEQLDKNDQVITVQQGNTFTQQSENAFSLSANELSHFEQLFKSLSSANQLPRQILYLWPVTSSNTYAESSAARISHYETNMQTCFWGLFNLSKALCELDESIRLTVVSSDMQAIGAACCPEKATLLGPVTVLPHELPQLVTQSIDVSPSLFKAAGLEKTADQILQEIRSANDERVVAYRGGDRWVRRIESAPVASNDNTRKPWLRQGGSYLITGGLGGIGLAIAEHMARSGAGHIVLLSRGGMPERDSWPDWIAQHAANDLTSQRIQKVQAIEALGAKVTALVADVLDAQSMHRAIEMVTSQTGTLHGVLHAAGSIDDQLIMMKSAESARSVIDVKIKGTLILDELFDSVDLDFFVVFSSIASFLGLPGQIDYTAANAFLDAFAIERSQRKSGQSLAINWNAWQDVGMASAANQAEREGVIAGRDKIATEQENLDFRVDLDDGEYVYGSVYDRNSHWILAEHQVKNGNAVMPGTGFLNLMVAVAHELPLSEKTLGSSEKNIFANASIEISDVEFLSPFELFDDTKALNIFVQPNEENFALQFYSDTIELPHAAGVVRLSPRAALPMFDLAAVQAQYTTEIKTKGRFLNQDFMQFGPRWACIKQIIHQGSAALVTIELAADLQGDLADYALHPALLDMATGGAQFLIDGFDQDRDFYVPVSYQRVVLIERLPSTFYSHVKYRQDSPAGFALFDIDIVDLTGRVIVQVEGFTMKKVITQFAAAGQSAGGSIGQSTEQTSLSSLDEVLKNAIGAAEGIQAFASVMAQQTQAQWIVSSVDTGLWLQQLDGQFDVQEAAPKIRYMRNADDDEESDIGFADDPNYVAPETAEQATMAELWSATLGVGRVGIRDNFFELGGHSLLLIRLATKIKKTFGVNLQASQFFDEPTIEKWSELVKAASEKDQGSVKKIKRAVRGEHRKSI